MDPSATGYNWSVAAPAGPLREEAGLALEHLVAATQVRYPSVSELARGVVFLTADEAEFITGSTLSINGGQHMY